MAVVNQKVENHSMRKSVFYTSKTSPTMMEYTWKVTRGEAHGMEISTQGIRGGGAALAKLIRRPQLTATIAAADWPATRLTFRRGFGWTGHSLAQGAPERNQAVSGRHHLSLPIIRSRHENNRQYASHAPCSATLTTVPPDG